MKDIISSKYCFVPFCGNTTSLTPDKMFISVPHNKDIRHLWCQAAGCPDKTLKKVSYCCEDHFDIEKDLENYLYVKTMGGRKFLRKGVLPRFFACQEEKPIISGNKTNSVTRDEVKNSEEVPMFHNVNVDAENFHSEEIKCEFEEDSNWSLNILKKPKIERSSESMSIGTSQNDSEDPLSYTNSLLDCNIETDVTINSRNIALTNEIGSEIKSSQSSNLLKISDLVSQCREISEAAINFSYENAEDKSSPCINERSQGSTIVRSTMSFNMIIMIEDNPLLFIGMPKQSMYIISQLKNALNIDILYIYMILHKIKCKCSNEEMAYFFKSSESQIVEIFSTYVGKIADFLQRFIVWPSPETIVEASPLNFKFGYNAVQSILACFEMQIKMPQNALHRPLTWSEHKKCHTVKYLISIMPNGLINFISKGYSGQTPDVGIVEDSDYLQVLPPGAPVLVDTGFEKLDVILSQQGSTLIKTTSCQNDKRFSTNEVILTTRMINVSIHIDRTIYRLREFKILDDNVCIDDFTLRHLDHIVKIASVLVNHQLPLLNNL